MKGASLRYVLTGLILATLIGFSQADGNITTTSGDINLNAAGGNVQVNNGGILRVNGAGNSNNIQLYHDNTDAHLAVSSGKFWFNLPNLDSYWYRSGTWLTNKGVGTEGMRIETTTNNCYFRLDSQSTGNAGLTAMADDGVNYFQLVIMNGSYNSYGDPGSTMLYTTKNFTIESVGRTVYPYENGVYNFGTPGKMWNKCYCKSFLTQSDGYVGSSKQAYDAVTGIVTQPDGEIDHNTVDKTLSDDGGTSINMNSLNVANSMAIGYVKQKEDARIDALEERISELENQVKECKR